MSQLLVDSQHSFIHERLLDTCACSVDSYIDLVAELGVTGAVGLLHPVELAPVRAGELEVEYSAIGAGLAREKSRIA